MSYEVLQAVKVNPSQVFPTIKSVTDSVSSTSSGFGSQVTCLPTMSLTNTAVMVITLQIYLHVHPHFKNISLGLPCWRSGWEAAC